MNDRISFSELMPAGGYNYYSSWNRPAWNGQSNIYGQQAYPYPERRQLGSIGNHPDWYGQGGIPTMPSPSFPAPRFESTFIGNQPLGVDPLQRQVPFSAANLSDGNNGKENPATMMQPPPRLTHQSSANTETVPTTESIDKNAGSKSPEIQQE